MCKNVRRNQNNKIEAFSVFSGINDLVIPDACTITNNNETFLIYDSHDRSKRFLVFSTKKNLKFLRTIAGRQNF